MNLNEIKTCENRGELQFFINNFAYDCDSQESSLKSAKENLDRKTANLARVIENNAKCRRPEKYNDSARADLAKAQAKFDAENAKMNEMGEICKAVYERMESLGA